MFQSNAAGKKKHISFSTMFFDTRVIYEIMWKNIVQPDRPQMTIQYGAWALHGGKYAYRHTLRICNTYCFSTTLGNVNAPQCYVCMYSTVCVLTDSDSVCTV